MEQLGEPSGRIEEDLEHVGEHMIELRRIWNSLESHWIKTEKDLKQQGEPPC